MAIPDIAFLVNVTETAQEAGFRWKVFLTEDLDTVIHTIPTPVAHQDYAGRLWDVLWMGLVAIRNGTNVVVRNDPTMTYQLILHTMQNTPDGITPSYEDESPYLYPVYSEIKVMGGQPTIVLDIVRDPADSDEGEWEE